MPRRLLFLVLVCGCFEFTRAEDTVTIRLGKEGRLRGRLLGEVVDYHGAGLTILLTNGRQEFVAPERILRVDTTLQPKHASADDLMRQGKFLEAIPLYRDAANIEKRPWVTRRMIASSSQCYLQTQQIERAGDLFLGLYRKDPITPHFDILPLSWTRIDSNMALQQKALTWLKDETSAAQLMGASWLISLGERRASVETLQRLSSDKDARVSHLADAQLWRIRLVQVTTDDVARWKTQIEKIPQGLRSGPYFMLGLALSRLDRPEDAAIAFLRVPVHFPLQRNLANEALLAAGKELEKQSQQESAVTLYRELLATRLDGPALVEAETRLRKITSQGGRSE